MCMRVSVNAIQDVSSAISKLNLSIENATITTTKNAGVEDTFLVKVSEGIALLFSAVSSLLRAAPDHMVTHIPGFSTFSACCLCSL